MMAHHATHRGYDRVPGVPGRYTARHFASGWRRLLDWPDWIHPESLKVLRQARAPFNLRDFLFAPSRLTPEFDAAF